MVKHHLSAYFCLPWKILYDFPDNTKILVLTHLDFFKTQEQTQEMQSKAMECLHNGGFLIIDALHSDNVKYKLGADFFQYVADIAMAVTFPIQKLTIPNIKVEE